MRQSELFIILSFRIPLSFFRGEKSVFIRQKISQSQMVLMWNFLCQLLRNDITKLIQFRLHRSEVILNLL